MAERSPIVVRELDHVVLLTRDVPRLQRFYCDLLGCSVEKVQAQIGLVQLRAGRSLIDLVDVSNRPAAAGGANMDHFCLRLEPFDADAITRFLRAHDVEPGELASRYGAEGQGPSLYIQDPDGNTVELKGPPWPAGSPAPVSRSGGA
jgi:glyoxylase I family protein